jgi:Tfp pilus assembly protein PilO
MIIKEKQQLIICLAAAVMVAAFVTGRYLPMHLAKNDAARRRAEQLAVIAKGQADSRLLPALRQRLESETASIASYDLQVPSQAQLGEFLQAASAIMNDLGLQEPLIQPGREIQTGDLNVIPLDIRCKGSLEQMFDFYKTLQGMPRMIRIEEVNLTNDRNYSGLVTMYTKAAIYNERPKANAGIAKID